MDRFSLQLVKQVFTVQKPQKRKIIKGDAKEIRRERKILDDNEKHLKEKKKKL